MKRFFGNYRLPENPEVLFLLVFGILLQMTDGSPFTMKEKWMIVWDTELPVEYFSHFVQRIIKTVLSVIVVVRCATTYAYVVSAMLVIFSLLKNSAPKLMLLWLLIAGLKSILLTFLEALVGVYVCSAFGQIRKACIEFVISKALEIIFATYLWGSVLNIYQEMERKAESIKKPELWEQLFLLKEGGRQRGRSLPDESTMYKTTCLNNFEFKDVPQIILQMLRRGEEMSRDSLLDPGMMLASVSNMGSFDNLKTSQSLGELGFVDLRSAQVVGLEEDETSTPQDKALRFLKLTWSDVRRAQRNKAPLESDIYRIDPDIWRKVVCSGTHINTPKRPRAAEVYIREIQQAEPEDDNRKIRKRSFDLKFSWSFFNLYTEKHVSPQEIDDEQDEESVIFREDEDEDEEEKEKTEEPTPLFMSNIKEEVVVNRIRLDFVSKKMKGNAYAELYKQDYMSVIGPEVFDKATKLQKVTSLTKINNYVGSITSIRQPVFAEAVDKKKINFNKESEEKMYQTSSSELDLGEFSPEEQITEEIQTKEKSVRLAMANNKESVLALGKKLSFLVETDKTATQSDEQLLNLKANSLCESENSQIEEMYENTVPSSSIILNRESTDFNEPTSPCYRRRKIKIRRIGKRSTVSSDCENFLKNSSTYCDHQPPSKVVFGQENSENHKKSDMWSSQSNTGTSLRDLDHRQKSFLAPRNEHLYFLLSHFQKPLLDVLVTYNNLKDKTHAADSGGETTFTDFLFKRYQVIDYESEQSQQRMWKSEVLKAVEAYRRRSSQVKFSDIREDKFITRKLLAYFVQKYYSAKTEEKEVFLSLCVSDNCEWSSYLNEMNENFKNSTLYRSEETDQLKTDNKMSFYENFKGTEEATFHDIPCEEQTVDTFCPTLNDSSGRQCLGSTKDTNSSNDNSLQLSNRETLKSDTNLKKLIFKEQDKTPEVQESFDLTSTSMIFEGHPEEESVSSQESDEPISLYYSKAANLASPLLDVKRFIYPDHIHYSYKHVKKKGFDVDISGGFPLLVRESLTMSTPANHDPLSSHPDFAITRRPMDLSFATTNAFSEWQNNDQNDTDSIFSKAKKTKGRAGEICHSKRERKSDLLKNENTHSFNNNNEKNRSHVSQRTEYKDKVKSYQSRNFADFKQLCSSEDYLLIEKLLKMHFQLNSKQYTEFRNPEHERTPVQISSTQLHSNKGRVNSTYNPAIFLQENKSRNEKKKMETQEERTKDMFARLEREALLQSRNLHKSSLPFQRI